MPLRMRNMLLARILPDIEVLLSDVKHMWLPHLFPLLFLVLLTMAPYNINFFGGELVVIFVVF